MSPFPRQLLAWRKQLVCLPEDLATSLGKLIVRLAPLVDAFSARDTPAVGEVAEFDGIAQRGSYERLLPTEWLLREAAPVEFLRRAASSEQAFFRLAYREPTPVRATLVLLDAGPDQLGGCRIAQLAMLALLTQRAEQRGESFDWQLIHHLGEAPLHTFDEQSVRAFLGGRTALRSTRKALESWRQRFPDHVIWTFSDGLLALDENAHVTVSIRERVTPDEALLDLQFAARGRATRQLLLQLPEPAIAVRLLRNPFEVRRPARVASDAQCVSNLVLNEKGTHLYFVDRAGDLRQTAIPNSPRAPLSRLRSYQPVNGSSIIGVTGQKQELHWLCAHDSTLTLCTNYRERELLRASCRVPFPEAQRGLWPIAWFAEQRMATFVAPDRTLWRADFRTGVAGPVARGVRAILNRRGLRLVAVDHWVDAEGVESAHLLEIEPFRVRPILRPQQPWGAVLLNRPGEEANTYCLVLDDGSGDVRISFREQEGATSRIVAQFAVKIPAGSIVAGQVRDGSLLLLDATRTELLRANRSQVSSLHRVDSPIDYLTCASAGMVVAFLTEANELCALRDDGEMLVRRGLEP